MDTVAMATEGLSEGAVGYVSELGAAAMFVEPNSEIQKAESLGHASIPHMHSKNDTETGSGLIEVANGAPCTSCRVEDLPARIPASTMKTATSMPPTAEVVAASGQRTLTPEVVRRRKQPATGRECRNHCGMYVVSPVRFMNNRARPGQAYVPTRFEHIANMVTHGLIILPAILGLYWMLSLTTTDGQYWSALVYGAATLALFITSTTFHTLSYHYEKYGTLRECFHYGDRAIIYVFIAASYTPWLILKECHSFLGTFTLWVVWIAAAAGILYQYTFHERYKLLETLLYIIIAVCPSIIIMAMKETTGLYEMGIGGMVYIIGVIFFKCDGVIPFAHAIWHCFVFVGVVFHYVAVCKHLLGTKNIVGGDIQS